MSTRKSEEHEWLDLREVDGRLVLEIDGQLVLEDPDAAAAAIIRVANKHKCLATFEENAEQIGHFKELLTHHDLSEGRVVIIIVNLNDIYGSQFAENLFPSLDREVIHQQEGPVFARGIAMRDDIQGALEIFDKEAAKKLSDMSGMTVVVVDHGVAEVFPA